MDESRLIDLVFRTEEQYSDRDSIGNFESQHAERRWEAPLYYPVINQEIVRHDPSWLEEIHWPHGKAFAACLTHDVDTVQLQSRRELARTIWLQISRTTDPIKRLKCLLGIVGLRRSPKPLDIFTPWIELESRYGFHSTFFFFSTELSKRHIRDDVYRWNDPTWYRGKRVEVKDVIRDLHHTGWDIGLHGSYLSAGSYDLLAEQKEDLEKALGDQVYTTRQHNLHYDAKLTPILHDRVGFHADSSLGFNRDIGFRAGIAYPFRVWHQSDGRWLGTLQIPLILQDGAILRSDNLDLNQEAAFAVCRKIMDRVIETKGVVTLLWHPDTIAKPTWFKLYVQLLGYISEKNGWGASAKEIHDWWVGQGLLEKLEQRLKGLEDAKAGILH
jgi:hypothetical protein